MATEPTIWAQRLGLGLSNPNAFFKRGTRKTMYTSPPTQNHPLNPRQSVNSGPEPWDQNPNYPVSTPRLLSFKGSIGVPLREPLRDLEDPVLGPCLVGWQAEGALNLGPRSSFSGAGSVGSSVVCVCVCVCLCLCLCLCLCVCVCVCALLFLGGGGRDL